jgi:hypothetical protein
MNSKCASPVGNRPFPAVVKPQYPVLAVRALPPIAGPKASPFRLGRTGVSGINDTSGAGSRLSPVKSGRTKAPSSPEIMGLFVIEVADAPTIEEYIARWDMSPYINRL